MTTHNEMFNNTIEADPKMIKDRSALKEMFDGKLNARFEKCWENPAVVIYSETEKLKKEGFEVFFVADPDMKWQHDGKTYKKGVPVHNLINGNFKVIINGVLFNYKFESERLEYEMGNQYESLTLSETARVLLRVDYVVSTTLFGHQVEISKGGKCRLDGNNDLFFYDLEKAVEYIVKLNAEKNKVHGIYDH